jgi:hypothetical protein
MRRQHTPLRLYLLLSILLGCGCADILDLDEYAASQPPPPPDPNSYTCQCTCSGIGTMTSVRDLMVCLPPDLNPKFGGVPASDQDIMTHCSDRVEPTVDTLSGICQTVNCDCTAQLATKPRRYEASCDDECQENLLLPGCTNFDPFLGSKTATNTPATEKVCTVASADPPVPTPDPVAASGLFGRRTLCEVGGSVTAMIDDDEQTQAAQGQIEFDGGPCPGVGCATGMSYELVVDPFEFTGFLGLVSVELKDITAIGASQPGAAVLDPSGVGQFPAESTLTSGRGTRVDTDPFSTDESTGALLGSNVVALDVTVDWIANQCSLSGNILGAIGTDSELAITVDLAGTIVNQPPEADAGPDQTLECSSPDGADVVLDASGSTDPEPNLALAGWRRGSRFAPDPADQVGPDDFGTIFTVPQGFGTEIYHLRVIDALMQASEDSLEATVEDTTPPVISDVTATPDSLWPPNHKLRTVSVAITATDTSDPDPDCKVVSVTSNEPVNGRGDGNTSPDWMITGYFSIELRSERSGNGSGRVYTIGVECRDDFENTSSSSVTVAVAHDQG